MRKKVALLGIMRNYLSTLLILLLCLAGCDSSKEEDSFFGTYRVTHFNGQSLPAEATIGSPPFSFILGITGGSLVLRENMTFVSSIDQYTIVMGTRSEETEESSGEFTITGNEIEFLSSLGRSSGTIRENVIVADFPPNLQLTFEKN